MEKVGTTGVLQNLYKDINEYTHLQACGSFRFASRVNQASNPSVERYRVIRQRSKRYPYTHAV